MTATVTITKPTTENEHWFVANREKYNLGIELSGSGIYSAGEYLKIPGYMFLNDFCGVFSRDLDVCLGKLRDYIEGDHQ